WGEVCADCSGAIDSLVELLQGQFSERVMTRVCEKGRGLFPAPAEISFTCSCPDWAAMCKHVAAVLYGVGARLDEQPQLLFLLRQVDHQDLITRAGRQLSTTATLRKPARVLEHDDLSALFGIEIGETADVVPKRMPGTRAHAIKPAAKRSRSPRKKR